MPVLVNMPSLDPSDIVKAKNDIEALKTNKADKTQISNPNLLDNPWFTVNQRGLSEYNSAGYTVDRWDFKNIVNGEKIVVNEDNSITHVMVSGSSASEFHQLFEESFVKNLNGKTFTISAYVNDEILTLTIPNFDYTVNKYYGIVPSSKKFSFGFRSIPEAKLWMVRTLKYSTDTEGEYTIKAMKLEMGETSTLHMDTVPNYQQELAKCQRYYQKYTDNAGCILAMGYIFLYLQKPLRERVYFFRV